MLGCPNDTTDEADTWSPVSSLEQLDGTWKGEFSESGPMDTEDYSEEAAAGLKDIKETTKTEMTATIDAAAANPVLQITGMKATTTYSGGNISQVWEAIKSVFETMKALLEDGAEPPEGMEDMEDIKAIEITDANYSVTVTMKDITLPMDSETLTGWGLEINQDGTKIKIPKDIMESPADIIMSKQ